MGLDGVMIVMATEKAFDLTILNSEAERMRTPGDIVNWVAARVRMDPEPACLSLVTFYQLRRALAAATGFGRQQLLPRTSIASLATRETWPAIWTKVQQIAGSPAWPDILWTRFIHRTPLTLRGIVELILMERVVEEPPANGRWTRSQIEYTIRRIVLLETGRSEYRLSASFVRDLGVS